jgi:DNA-binding transcriptional LysR family regulator
MGEEGLNSAEAAMREAGQLLLDARPEAVDRCQAALQRAAEILQRIIGERAGEGAPPADPLLPPALLRIRQLASVLKLQIECASNLCSGWLQLSMGAGYTAQGLPVLNEPGGRSFEA